MKGEAVLKSFWLVLCLTIVGTTGWGQTEAPRSQVGEAFNPEHAARSYLDQLSAEKRARSNAYFEGGYWIQLWQFLAGVGMAWILLATRASAAMRDFAEKLTRFRFVHFAGYGVLYILAVSLMSFPLAAYTDFFREHQYALATHRFGEWFMDWAKGIVLTVIFGSLILVTLMAVVRRLPRAWPVVGTIVSLLFLILAVLIAPVYIAPLFNTYRPLADPNVLNPILSLARANGIPAHQVYEMDASRQTTRISANVSGIFGTTRITLNDNLLQRCSLAEVEAVMAHEMGHYVLNHVYKMLIFFGAIIALGFILLRWALAVTLTRYGAKWGIAGLTDVAVVPLVVALFSAYLFVLTPVINTFVRVQESEADIFGLNAARRPDGFAEAALKLADYRKMEPGPAEEFLFYDHPSGATRIRMAMRWKAENLASADNRKLLGPKGPD